MGRIENKNKLKDLFYEVKAELKGFNRKNYESSMDQIYATYLETFDAIAKECSEDENVEELLKEYAQVFSNIVVDDLASLNKRKREYQMLDYNMSMVTYIIPLLSRHRTKEMDLFSETCIEIWNENLPNNKIGKSTQEGIQGGFKTGICYITTAVCESLGKPDDCYELNLLRNYRDEYLEKETADGKDIIRTYYDIAPTIVKRINKLETSNEIYTEIWNTYLSPCIELIEQDEKQPCKELYMNMVQTLSKKYFTS